MVPNPSALRINEAVLNIGHKERFVSGQFAIYCIHTGRRPVDEEIKVINLTFVEKRLINVSVILICRMPVNEKITLARGKLVVTVAQVTN